MKTIKFVAFLYILTFGAIAGNPAHISDHKHWSVYKTSDGVKYLVGYPVADEGNFAKREKPYFMVTNFDGNPEISVYVGYYYKKESEPKAVVHLSTKDPNKIETYKFSVKNDMAWHKDGPRENHFINSLKNGDRVIITSESTKNTGAKDTYSLEGFSAAYNEIMKK